MLKNKNLIIQIIELADSIEKGYRPVIVINKNFLSEGESIREGMLARIEKISIKEKNEFGITCDFSLDFKEFERYNSVSQVGFHYVRVEDYKNIINPIKYTISNGNIFFYLYDNEDNEVFNKYLKSDSDLDYSSWLEKKMSAWWW